jgi:formiminoglutamase
MFDFLDPVDVQFLNLQEEAQGQYNTTTAINKNGNVHWEDAHIVLIGINEHRGAGIGAINHAQNTIAIRNAFYNLYQWHHHIKIADIGDIKLGKTVQDTYSALGTVIKELTQAGKKVICIGGSHDNSLGVYKAFQSLQLQIEFTCVDATIDLSLESYKRNENFLLEMLTFPNNYVKHYNHLGFQSYLAHPKMMETLDALRFDCHRLGKLRQQMSLYEPIIRNSHFLSIDVNVLQPAFMPCNTISPNGLAGDEACLLTKYAGFSNTLKVLSIHEYDAQKDTNQLGAMQIAQMLWYYIDGFSNLFGEKALSLYKDSYNEYHTLFSDNQISFFQNKENNKWWMQLPDGNVIACTYEDYLTASHNEIPETWLRYQERLV